MFLAQKLTDLHYLKTIEINKSFAWKIFDFLKVGFKTFGEK